MRRCKPNSTKPNPPQARLPMSSTVAGAWFCVSQCRSARHQLASLRPCDKSVKAHTHTQLNTVLGIMSATANVYCILRAAQLGSRGEVNLTMLAAGVPLRVLPRVLLEQQGCVASPCD
eukprot:1803299-Amphidinium_carterae.1